MRYLLLLLLSTNVIACPDQQAFLSEYIKQVNKKAPAEQIAQAIMVASSMHQVDPYLVLAQIEIESGFNPNATGSRGERGLLQIRQSTAKDLGLPWENAYDILMNIEAGTRYLSTHLRKYSTTERALSRYNGKGPKSEQYAIKVKARYLAIVWNKL